MHHKPILITIIFSALLFASVDTQVVAHWSFDSSSQGTFYDVTGNGYDAVGANLGVTDGVSGKALDCYTPGFDLKVSNSIGNFDLDNFTVEGWIYPYIDMVNPGSFYNYKQLFDYVHCGLEGSGEAQGFSLHITDRGKFQISMSNPPHVSGPWTSIQADSVFSPRKWYHIVGTYDGAEINLYINGKLVKKAAHSHGFLPSDIEARIGCQFQVTSGKEGRMRNWFKGKIDELRLYNYALEPQVISSHYNDLKPFSEPAFEINLGMKTTYAEPGDTVIMPVFLTNFEDFPISACQFSLNFDTGKLELINISKDSGLVKEWPLFNWSPSGNITKIALGGVQKSISYGEGELLRCIFVVKKSTPKGDSCVIGIQDVVIDESMHLVTATTQNGKIITNKAEILYGDVTGNNVVNIFDAQKVLAYVVGALTLPDELCPNFTVAVADVSGNGSVTSYDAALIFQHSVGLLPEFPVESKTYGNLLKRSQTQPEKATLSIKAENKGHDGISYKLVGSNLKGLTAGEFSIEYDPSVINLNNGSIITGIRGATLNSRLDSEKKLLKIAIVTNDDIDNNDPVTLADIILPPAKDIIGSAFSIAAALINEGKITTDFSSSIFDRQSKPGMNRAPCSFRFIGSKLVVNRLEKANTDLRIWTLNGKAIEYKRLSSNIGTEVVNLNFAGGVYLFQIRIGSKTTNGRFVISK